MATHEKDFDPSEEDFLSCVDLENIGLGQPTEAKRQTPVSDRPHKPSPLQTRNHHFKEVIGNRNGVKNSQTATVNTPSGRSFSFKSKFVSKPMPASTSPTIDPGHFGSSPGNSSATGKTSTGGCASTFTTPRDSDKTSPTVPVGHNRKVPPFVAIGNNNANVATNPKFTTDKGNNNAMDICQSADDSFSSDLDLSLLTSPAGWNPTAQTGSVGSAQYMISKNLLKNTSSSSRVSSNLNATNVRPELFRTPVCSSNTPSLSDNKCNSSSITTTKFAAHGDAGANTQKVPILRETDSRAKDEHSAISQPTNVGAVLRPPSTGHLRAEVEKKYSTPPKEKLAVEVSTNLDVLRGPGTNHSLPSFAGHVPSLSATTEQPLASNSVQDQKRESNCTPVRSNTPTTGNSAKRKRKFPGPAGALPKLKPGVDLNAVPVLSAPNTPAPKAQCTEDSESLSQVPCSQSVEDFFSDSSWLTMKRDLEAQAAKILSQFSLSNVVKKAGKKLLPNSKVPVVCAVIDNINMTNLDASVILKDPSGEMKGTIHREIMKSHEERLQVGSVLVLRQVGVFSPSPKSHYLNITPNNVVCVYSKDSQGKLYTERTAHFKQEDFIVPPPKPPAPRIPVVQQGNQGFPGRSPRPSAWTTTGGPRFPAPTASTLRPYRPPGQYSTPRSGYGQGYPPRSSYTGHGGQQGQHGVVNYGNQANGISNVRNTSYNPGPRGAAHTSGIRSFSPAQRTHSLIRPVSRYPTDHNNPTRMAGSTYRLASVNSSGTSQNQWRPPSGSNISRGPTPPRAFVPVSNRVTGNVSLIRPCSSNSNDSIVTSGTPGGMKLSGATTFNPTVQTKPVTNKFTFHRPVQNDAKYSSSIRASTDNTSVGSTSAGKAAAAPGYLQRSKDVVESKTVTADLWQDDNLDDLLMMIDDDNQ